jgi:carboxypeptidase PM20D1
MWYVLLIFLVTMIGVVLLRTLDFAPPRAPENAPPIELPPPGEAQLARLTRAISIPTVCAQNYADTDFSPFDEYIAFLADAFPLFHSTCELTRINTYALVFRWAGRDRAAPPMMLTAHYDVVPVEAGTEDEWKYPGFSGRVAEGRVWGRGTLDIKGQMIAQLEAAEALMAGGFVPARDILFVYGQDEEIGGQNGAAKVADYFQRQGIRLAGVLDEGGIVAAGVIKGIRPPLAMIGVAEKGFCNYELAVPGTGGHASMPPPHTALGQLARLLAEVEKHPLPARLTPPVELMLRNLAGEMGFVVRMAVANLWLFRPILMKVLCGNPTTAAMVRTTLAPTMARASDAANVLPQRAFGAVNVRLLHGDDSAKVKAHFERLAAGLGLAGAKVKPLAIQEPSQVSPVEGPVYELIRSCIRQVWPGALTTPYLVMGGTDSRKYYGVCDHIYRFTPLLITGEEKDSMHSTNESVEVLNYARMIDFFRRFIEQLA